jgi:hypothetical protein
MGAESILYHYTTQDGFLGIVKQAAIRASSIQHLNDASEFHYASSIVFEVLDETTRDAKVKERLWAITSSAQYAWDSFVTSFSADGDQLGQWRAYGRSAGFSIGFDMESLITRAKKQGYVLERCSYNAAQNKAEIKPLVEWAVRHSEDFDSSHFLEQFLTLAPKFKHPSFIAEQEWRLVNVRPAPFACGKNYTDISYRSGKSFFVPFRMIALTDSTNPDEALLPISKVYVGPTPHAELSVWTVRNCLRTKGLFMNGLKIEKSAIPYRDW